MDKRNRRPEPFDKKIDIKIRDRGDLGPKRYIDKSSKKNDETNKGVTKVQYPDRGDSKSTNLKHEKMRINMVVRKLTNDELKLQNALNALSTEKIQSFKNKEKNRQDESYMETELRKRIRDRYTLKLKNVANRNNSMNLTNKKEDSSKNRDSGSVASKYFTNSSINKKDDSSRSQDSKSIISKTTDRSRKHLSEETTQTSSLSSAKTDFRKKNEKVHEHTSPVKSEKAAKQATKQEKKVPRKPMIKTVMSKNGSVKIYKAVTFVDQKIPPTPLQIVIPGNGFRKQKNSKLKDSSPIKVTNNAVSPQRAFSVKEKDVPVRRKTERKRDRRRRHVVSPDLAGRDANRSPPTEVARWAPACIDRHTKPYYEAWVNTTLAAISTNSNKDKALYDKQRKQLLQQVQRAIEERSRSPELVYENFSDERYTGRIKVTQR